LLIKEPRECVAPIGRFRWTRPWSDRRSRPRRARPKWRLRARVAPYDSIAISSSSNARLGAEAFSQSQFRKAETGRPKTHAGCLGREFKFIPAGCGFQLGLACMLVFNRLRVKNIRARTLASRLGIARFACTLPMARGGDLVPHNFAGSLRVNTSIRALILEVICQNDLVRTLENLDHFLAATFCQVLDSFSYPETGDGQRSGRI
jgi:hypothetical protein